MSDDKIISDRTLDLENEEIDEKRHAQELPEADRDREPQFESGSLLSGDSLSGTGDESDDQATDDIMSSDKPERTS